MKIASIVLSFKNEEDNIPELVSRISKVFNDLNSWDYELVFVNDCSTDNSEKILTELQQKYPINIINMSRTFGVGPCILAGFKYANGDCVIYMDSDLQDPPETIPQLIKEFESGFEVVHTIRTERRGENYFKLLITKIAYKFINFLSDINLHVNSGDFKLISRKVIKVILAQGDFDPYIRGLSLWAGFNQSSVNYVREARFSGVTHFPIFSKGPALEFLRGVTSHSTKPLFLSIFLGIFGILFSIFLALYILFLKLNNLTYSGTATIVISISFFSGLILFNLGILGIYLGKIFEQTKNRSMYVIKDIKYYNKLDKK